MQIKLKRLVMIMLLFISVNIVYAQSGFIKDKKTGAKFYTGANSKIRSFLWSGSILNGFINGNGRLIIYENDTEFYTYSGFVKVGYFSGNGTILSSSGDKYVGQFKNSLKDGNGTYTFSNGDIYVGQFKDNDISGNGTFTFSNGNKYVGQFKNEKRNGYGTYTFSNGDIYVGQFKDNDISGNGTFTFSNGNKYVGQFKNEKRNGYGTFTYSNGEKLKGNWKDDEFVYSNNKEVVNSYNPFENEPCKCKIKAVRRDYNITMKASNLFDCGYEKLCDGILEEITYKNETKEYWYVLVLGQNASYFIAYVYRNVNIDFNFNQDLICQDASSDKVYIMKYGTSYEQIVTKGNSTQYYFHAKGSFIDDYSIRNNNTPVGLEVNFLRLNNHNSISLLGRENKLDLLSCNNATAVLPKYSTENTLEFNGDYLDRVSYLIGNILTER